MLASFVLMLPAMMGSRSASKTKYWFVGSVALLIVAQAAMPWLAGGVWQITLFLLLFFVPFNILEAMLPSLTSRLAPANVKGAAIGVYSSVQFFGTFAGAAAGGFLYSRWGIDGVVVPGLLLLAIWLILAFGMNVPAPAGAARPESTAQ